MANITTQTIRVDLSTDKILPTAFTHQNDTARTLEFSIYNKGVPYTMTGNTVKFAYKSPIVDGQYSVIAGSSMANGTVSGNKVTVALPVAYTKISGVGLLTMIITPSSGTIRPVNIRLVVQKSADGDDVISGASDFPSKLEETVETWLEEYYDSYVDELAQTVVGDSYNLIYFTNTTEREVSNTTVSFPDKSTIVINGDNTSGSNASLAFNGATRATSDTILPSGTYTLHMNTSGTGGVRVYYKPESASSATRIYDGDTFTSAESIIFYLSIRQVNYSNFKAQLMLLQGADANAPYVAGGDTARDNVARALVDEALSDNESDEQFLLRKYPYILKEYVNNLTDDTRPTGFNITEINAYQTSNSGCEGLATDGFRYVWFSEILNSGGTTTATVYKYDSWKDEIAEKKTGLSIGHANSIAYVPETNRLYITGQTDFNVHILDADSLEVITSVTASSIYTSAVGYVSFCAFDRFSNEILYLYHATADASGTARKLVRCDPSNTFKSVTDIELADSSLSCGLAADNFYLYIGSGDSKILIFDKTDGTKLATVRAEISTYATYEESEDFDFIGNDLIRVYNKTESSVDYTSIAKLTPQ